MRRITHSAGLLAAFLCARLVSAQCPGDCNGDQRVSVGDLVRAVNISLGEAPLTDCPGLDVGGDGAVRFGDLVRAVNHSINGCPATPTPIPPPTPTIDFPDVSGVWDEAPLRAVTSTCLESFSAAFAAELGGRSPCPQPGLFKNPEVESHRRVQKPAKNKGVKDLVETGGRSGGGYTV